jgi:hypothetical protein
MREPVPERRAAVPRPLVVGFAAFVVLMVALVATSLRRREAPVHAPSSPTRTRAAGWERAGDTLTLDATDEVRWRRASLTLGRALDDTAGWELAGRRHRVTVAGALADLGAVSWDSARAGAGTRWIASTPREDGNAAIRRWYRYDFTTHLLAPAGHVYLLRTHAGRVWKLQVLGYYCPGVRAGCLTIRYAPLEAAAAHATETADRLPP